MLSMLGSGKSSLGHALLRSLKSVQQRTHPLGFATGTKFETHSG